MKLIVLYFALAALILSEISVHHEWAVFSPTEARGESQVQPPATFTALSHRLYQMLNVKRDCSNSAPSFRLCIKVVQKKPIKSSKVSPKIFLLNRALLI
jgi:hypothetical protein